MSNEMKDTEKMLANSGYGILISKDCEDIDMSGCYAEAMSKVFKDNPDNFKDYSEGDLKVVQKITDGSVLKDNIPK